MTTLTDALAAHRPHPARKRVWFAVSATLRRYPTRARAMRAAARYSAVHERVEVQRVTAWRVPELYRAQERRPVALYQDGTWILGRG